MGWVKEPRGKDSQNTADLSHVHVHVDFSMAGGLYRRVADQEVI
jgi:hypothetical protein